MDDSQIAYDERGLVPCVVQDWSTGEVLTLAYMNAEALRAHARDRRAAPLEPLARGAVAQGRDQRQHPGACARCARLRRRRAARARRARRAGLPHRRAHLLSPRRAGARGAVRGAAGARAHARRSAPASGPPAPTRSSCSTTRPRIGEKVMEEAEEVARAAREESDERVDEEAADVLYHLLVLLRSRGRVAGRRRAGARWPSPLTAPGASSPTPASEVRALGARAQPDPAAPHLHRRLRDAGVGVPEAARARTEPAFLLESAEQGQRVGRYSFIGFRPRAVLRWSLGDGGDPYALAAAAVARFGQAPLADAAAVHRRRGRLLRLRPRAHRRAARRAQPRPARPARHGADAHRRAGRLRPPQAHGHDPRQRRRRGRARRRARLRGGARRDRRGARALAGPGAARRADRAPTRSGAMPEFESNMPRERSSKRWWRGSSSTSTPATPSRSCPRSAGRRRCRSRRSRSTAACARSTRARTCTSSTSATSRSRARAPSRC